MDNEGYELLTSKHFPCAGMKNLRFVLKDGTVLDGKYDFNSTMARRWIDNNGNEYTSNLVYKYKQM